MIKHKPKTKYDPITIFLRLAYTENAKETKNSKHFISI